MLRLQQKGRKKKEGTRRKRERWVRKRGAKKEETKEQEALSLFLDIFREGRDPYHAAGTTDTSASTRYHYLIASQISLLSSCFSLFSWLSSLSFSNSHQLLILHICLFPLRLLSRWDVYTTLPRAASRLPVGKEGRRGKRNERRRGGE